MEKEANRFIQQWPAEKITIENGRWGPFVRFGKKMLKLTGKKYTPEEAAMIPLEAVKAMIEIQIPGAFAKKATPAKKAAPKKKVVVKKK